MARFFAVFPLAMLLLFPDPAFGEGEELPARGGEEAPGKGDAFFFSLLPLLLTVERGELFWTPDWPPEIPPDAFRLPTGEASSIVLRVGEHEYRLRRNSRGLLEEFPLPLGGTLVQVRALFGPAAQLRGFTIGKDPERVLEFQEAPPGSPQSVRLTVEGEVYSILYERRDWGYLETWHDGEDEFAAYFETSLQGDGDFPRITGRSGVSTQGEVREQYHYDGFGNLSEAEKPEGRFSALYTAPCLPRYWERYPQGEAPEEGGDGSQWLSLQGDEGGLLTRITGSAGAGEEGELDCRYEYTLDGRGNWTERREWRMLRRLGVLAAVYGPPVKRLIEYGR
jgi:hypothetical protein